MAVGIAINQPERACIKFDSSSWAGQRNPQLLIQMFKVLQISGSFKIDLIKAAGAKKFPLMSHRV